MDWQDRLRAAVNAKGKHAAVAAEANVSTKALSRILTGNTQDPNVQTLIRICAVCGVTLGWVFGEKGHELGDADYDSLARIHEWAGQKLEERKGVAAAPLRIMKELPAVATARGETWDEDEIRDRDIPREYQNQGVNAVFRTRGDSMINAGILDGDILFVRKTRNRNVANDKIIVCRLDGTFAVKRLRIEPNVITLISEDGTDPITINEDAERFQLIGIVIGVARDLVRR